MSFAQLLFVTAPKCYRCRLGDIFKKKIMFQWIEARRGAPWEATCEKSVCVVPLRLQGKDHSQNPSAIT